MEGHHRAKEGQGGDQLARVQGLFSPYPQRYLAWLQRTQIRSHPWELLQCPRGPRRPQEGKKVLRGYMQSWGSVADFSSGEQATYVGEPVVGWASGEVQGNQGACQLGLSS